MLAVSPMHYYLHAALFSQTPKPLLYFILSLHQQKVAISLEFHRGGSRICKKGRDPKGGPGGWYNPKIAPKQPKIGWICMIYLSKGGGGRCQFGPYVDPPLVSSSLDMNNINALMQCTFEVYYLCVVMPPQGIIMQMPSLTLSHVTP